MRVDRRTFARTLALGTGAVALPAWAQHRKLQIGHTGITWPGGQIGGRGAAGGPRQIDPAAIDAIVSDIASLGYYGLELFSWQIDGMEAHGGLGTLTEKRRLPLVSSYTGVNLTDPARRQEALDGLIATTRVVRKQGGRVIVIGPNSVPRAGYVFAEHRAEIVSRLNDSAKAVADLGLTPVLHQHTGTCIETRDETYAVMESVDTRYLKFGPDIGQLQKGGSDPVQVVRDFLPVVEHLHLKDFVGGDAFAGYCPLGQGKVDIPAILSMLDGRAMKGMAMVELDSSQNMPLAAAETARIAKAYLGRQGVTFRS